MMESVRLRFQIGDVPRFLARVATHVRRGFGPAVREGLSERAILLPVGQTATLPRRVRVEFTEPVLSIMRERDSPYSVVIAFDSDHIQFVKRIDGELPAWYEETEPTWHEDVLFIRNLLLAELPRMAALPSPTLEVIRYSADDFTSPSSEESIEIHRGARRDFASPLLFWVKSLQAQDWSGRTEYFAPYAQSSLCQSLGAGEFLQLVVNYSGGLIPPLPDFLRRAESVSRALRMYADWNDVAALAELPHDFVAFYWSTSA
jgi:hypothetical protein